MKIVDYTKIVLLIALFIPIVSLSPTKSLGNELPKPKLRPKPKLKSEYENTFILKNDLKIDNLVQALIQVESRGRDNITGDHHLGKNYAAGALQIRPVMLNEVNRILKLQKKSKRYTLNDRFNRKKSVEMFHIWREYHHNGDSFEKIIRNWNGGPRGYLRNSTKQHWIKTQSVLKDIY